MLAIVVHKSNTQLSSSAGFLEILGPKKFNLCVLVAPCHWLIEKCSHCRLYVGCFAYKSQRSWVPMFRTCGPAALTTSTTSTTTTTSSTTATNWTSTSTCNSSSTTNQKKPTQLTPLNSPSASITAAGRGCG